ncbi:MAG TPA: F0F1 ATP synthase subunit B [Chthoniobacterales bacterium]|nr:F0F1 ATP synthase subunit B [Chthoniobacterales bacterium]
MDQINNLMAQFGVAWPKLLAQIIIFITLYVTLNKLAFGPIIKVLEERRRRIEEGQANAEKIKVQLAESERRYEEIIHKANLEAQQMIEEARKSGDALSQKQAQDAIRQAEEIIAKAKADIQIERNKMESDVRKAMVGLVVETTSKVTGKVLTADDQTRLNEETTRQLAA